MRRQSVLTYWNSHWKRVLLVRNRHVYHPQQNAKQRRQLNPSPHGPWLSSGPSEEEEAALDRTEPYSAVISARNPRQPSIAPQPQTTYYEEEMTRVSSTISSLSRVCSSRRVCVLQDAALMPVSAAQHPMAGGCCMPSIHLSQRREMETLSPIFHWTTVGPLVVVERSTTPDG